ncbi:hypothetical protein [Streptomyces noursei]|uniref:hypothetical protein n=1 Tax=Streptomyces noursei TaxID=1971 RepID=UPI0023B8353B|nr:hypothetical protein [Streptomyces noursei]
MRRALAALLGTLALTGVLSAPAYADGTGPGVTGVLGDPLKVASDLGPLHVGRLPLLTRN